MEMGKKNDEQRGKGGGAEITGEIKDEESQKKGRHFQADKEV